MKRKVIDVSYHQGKIDWKQVASDGVEGAIIRAGYGVSTVDEQFLNNVKGCIKYGIPFGVYWFIYGVNEAEAIRNAEKFHQTIAAYKDKIALGVWADLEYDSDKYAKKRGVVLTKKVRTAMVVAFLERLKEYGYQVGNYANPDYLKSKFNDLSQYPLWLAHYNVDEKYCDCDIWQYTSKGTVKGIDGDVDMNICYRDFAVAAPAKKSILELAKEVIADKWGKNPDRARRLTEAGYDAKAVQAKVNELYAINKANTKPVEEYYTVKKGDNLTKIAEKYGTTIKQLQAWNGIKNPNEIYIGQKFRVR